MDNNEVFIALYERIFRARRGNSRHPRWKGIPVIKMPNDLLLYAQAIHEKNPDLLIETGTKFGGSATFFADMMDLVGHGQVVTVDINAAATPAHPRITYLSGRSTSTEIIDAMRSMSDGKRTMVVLDSLHTRRHVKRELVSYGQFVSAGMHMVVEDCYGDRGLCGPGEAVDWFLPRTKKFILDPVEDQFVTGVTRGGWLRRL